jgi:hypothetical protein
MPNPECSSTPGSNATASKAHQQITETTPEGSHHISVSKSSSRSEGKANAELNVTASSDLDETDDLVDAEDGTQPSERADGTPVLGDEVEGTIKVEYWTRTPHPGERKRRLLEFPLLVAAELRGKAKRAEERAPTDKEIATEVARRLKETAERRVDIEAALSEVLPESEAPDASKVDRWVEAAAVLRHPLMIWAWLRLLIYTTGPKHMPMWRRLAVATTLRMALISERPSCRAVVGDLCKNNRFRAWAFLWPGHPPTYPNKNQRWELSAFHKQVKKVLSTSNPYRMWQAINRDMLLELLGEHTVHSKMGGRFANCRDALTYIAVDGFLIQADLPQDSPKSEALARQIRGEDRKRCGYVKYVDKNGNKRKDCHGYKWMQLSLVKLGGLVLHGKLFPANVDERKATFELIAEAFEYWPELKQQKNIYLIGDGLYDQSEQFAYELTFRWGIHPVFPRAGKVASTYHLANQDGVPTCKCGKPATIKDAPDFPTPFYRVTRNLAEPGNYIADARGEIVDKARIRWTCAKATGKHCGFNEDTYPRENPRLYTYLPHGGNHNRAALRIALLNYRNIIESSFSNLKNMGLAGVSQDRPKWAGDDQMDHLVWMTIVAMTGRRLVHANGLYNQVWDEAHDRGLMQAAMPTEHQAALMTADEWSAMERAYKAYATPPTGWLNIGETPAKADDASDGDVHVEEDVHDLRQTGS